MTRIPIDPAYVDFVSNSDLFDADWYGRTYSDVKLSGLSPAEHYVWVGSKLGRHPSVYFDAQAYERAYPDALYSGLGALVHYLKVGRSKNHTVKPVAAVLYPYRDIGEMEESPHHFHCDDKMMKRIVTARATPVDPKFEFEHSIMKDEFDIDFYLTQNPGVARTSSVNPIQHYLETGANAKLDPSPHFGTSLYLARNKKVKDSGINPFLHWLMEGRANNLIAEPFEKFPIISRHLGLEPKEMSQHLTARRNDLFRRLRAGKLGEMVSKAAALDPLVALSWPAAFRPKIPPFHTNRTSHLLTGICELREAAEFRQASYVILINRARWGGGPKEEGYLARLLAEKYGGENVLVIFTDQPSQVPPGRFPASIRQVDFAEIAGSIPEENRVDLFCSFLRSLRPKAVFSINSRLFWNCLDTYRAILSAEMNIYLYFFCNEKNFLGFWTGYPIRFFYRNFDTATEVLVDSHYLKNELAERFLLSEEMKSRVRVIAAPADMAVQLMPDPVQGTSKTPQVFWAGRFDRQKRLDLVAAIADGMPDVTFRLWGRPLLDHFDSAEISRPNIQIEGVYEHFNDLPLQDCDAWLYTSEWDGVPHLLLEVGMTGIPLVGSSVGGTPEILKDRMSWPIADYENVDAYVAALNEILSDPPAARERARKLRRALAKERTGAELRDFVDQLGL